MEGPIGKIIMIAATIAIAGAVIAFAWFAIGENTPEDPGSPAADKAQIRDEHLCKAVGGTWTAATKNCA